MQTFILWLSSIQFWHWFGLAAVLLSVELLSGSGYILWCGISAAIVGLSVWCCPHIEWEWQLILFTVAALILAILWGKYLLSHPSVSDRPNLNRRNEQYMGRVVMITEPVINGYGVIRVDDSQWRIKSREDLPSGTKVKVVATDGVVLIVERCI